MFRLGIMGARRGLTFWNINRYTPFSSALTFFYPLEPKVRSNMGDNAPALPGTFGNAASLQP